MRRMTWHRLSCGNNWKEDEQEKVKISVWGMEVWGWQYIRSGGTGLPCTGPWGDGLWGEELCRVKDLCRGLAGGSPLVMRNQVTCHLPSCVLKRDRLRPWRGHGETGICLETGYVSDIIFWDPFGWKVISIYGLCVGLVMQRYHLWLHYMNYFNSVS